MSSENEDRLSMLPEEITSHILSLMPTKYAVQTCILSKTWRYSYSWMPVTSLNFEDIRSIDNITDFMDRVLELCTPSQLQLFRFRCIPYFDGPQSSIISIWIDQALRLNVRELDLLLHPLNLPFSVFTCKSLTKLTLYDYSNYRSVWDQSYHVALPSLKTLDIIFYKNPVVNAFKIINGCPILESLSLKIESINYDKDDYRFNIPTLKRLELDFRNLAFDHHKVVLQVPNLEYLRVGDYPRSLFVMEDVSSLVEASVSFSCPIYDGCKCKWEELLKGLSGVRFLSVEHTPHTFRLPIFPNIRRLMLKSFWSFRQVFQFLESSPGLKLLYLKENLLYSEWIEPTPVPACLLTSLTTINIKFSTWNWSWKHNMQFLKYILRNAEVLETLTITWEFSNVEEEQRLYEELLILPRASKCCEIWFNGLRVPVADKRSFSKYFVSVLVFLSKFKFKKSNL